MTLYLAITLLSFLFASAKTFLDLVFVQDEITYSHSRNGWRWLMLANFGMAVWAGWLLVGKL